MPNELEVFSFWEPASLSKQPREDYFAFDGKSGTFVIADGVGLYEGIEYVGKYPRSSGTYRISRAFCKAFINYLTRHPKGGIQEGFRVSNAAAARINEGRSKYDVFKKHKNLFAATAAMAKIKESVLEWGQIADAGVAVIGKDGKLKFRKDNDYWRVPLPKDIGFYESSTYTFSARTFLRNAISKEGKLLGYGVITGEPEAERYLRTGKCSLTRGDIVLLYTDGFTPYIKLPSFRKTILLTDSKRGFRIAIEDLIKTKNKINLFQHEKSIIIIKT